MEIYLPPQIHSRHALASSHVTGDAMRCAAMQCDAMRCAALRCNAMRCAALRCQPQAGSRFCIRTKVAPRVASDAVATCAPVPEHRAAADQQARCYRARHRERPWQHIECCRKEAPRHEACGKEASHEERSPGREIAL